MMEAVAGVGRGCETGGVGVFRVAPGDGGAGEADGVWHW